MSNATAMLPLALSLFALPCLADTRPAPDPAWVDEARSASARLAGALRAELQAALSEGGPTRGIQVCKVRAPEIAAASSNPRMTVGRTALRVRNPDNAPDAWEQQVLLGFAERIAAGEAPEAIETWTTVETEEGTVGRWMKAIPTGPICLTCHGASMPRDLEAAIDAAYPSDQATGFQLGELRGAFIVDVDLD